MFLKGQGWNPYEKGRAVAGRLPLFVWPLVLLLFGVWLAYEFAMLEHRAEDEQRRAAIRSALEPIRGALSRELFGAIQLTEGIAGLVAIEGGMSDERLRAFSAELLRRSDLIRAVAVAPGNVVRFVFPLEGNERAVGLEYAKNPEQWPSVDRMMRERRIVVAGPVNLVQGGVGVIGRKPVYLSTLHAQDARPYWGLISTVIDFERLLAKTAIAEQSKHFDIALRGVDGLGDGGKVFWGDAQVFASAPVSVDVPLTSGSWRLAAIPRGGWPPPRVLASPYFLSGSLLAAVLAAFLFGLLHTGAARQRVADVLAKREHQLQEAMRVGRVGLWHWDLTTDMVTLFDNAHMYGLDEGLTLSVRELFERLAVPEDAASLGDALQKARQDRGRLDVDYRIRRQSGEVSWFSAQGEFAGGADVMVGTFIDITERKRALEQIQKLNDALQRHAEDLERRVAERTAELALAKDRAESADRLKSAFLATMSHELRTPLNSIIGFTGIILQGMAGPLNEEQQKQLGMVQNSARHLLALINDVLDISKIEAGELTVAAEPFDAAASIRRVADIVRPMVEKKNLALSVEVAEGVGPMIGDARRVEQILLNLLSNAIKFTDKGGVSLVADTIDGYSERQGGAPVTALRLRVADTGIGIRPEHMPQLFQPFRQVDSAISRAYEGTGLGLAISQRLARLMGGNIEATSRWQQGSEFTVVLPLQHDKSHIA